MKRSYLRFPATAILVATLFACQKDMSARAKSDLNSLESSSSSSFNIASDCGQLRTQTQGGWGSTPSGNNPGVYLHANFDIVFGEGLTVGCNPDNFYVKLTSAQAVTNLLPVGGKAAALTASVTDPASLKNVLAGQLVALKLSVTFDAYDYDFGSSPVALGDMVIGSGTFKGYSVSQFLATAEQVLGGCSTAFTLTQINVTASAINENNVDGNTNNGFLICPEGNGGGNGGGDGIMPG